MSSKEGFTQNNPNFYPVTELIFRVRPVSVGAARGVWAERQKMRNEWFN